MIDFNELQKPLSVDEIDFRVQSINNGMYATILAYKDARVDINRLNKVCTPLGWKREHARDNHNCIVSLWDEENKHWVSKEDTGTESAAEAQKGLASDSFKRACFNLGIGIELYSYPTISVKLKPDEVTETGKTKPKYRGSFNLKIKEWKWESEFKEGKIVKLKAIDNKGGVRFDYSITQAKPVVNISKEETNIKEKQPLTQKGFEYLKKKGTLKEVKEALSDRKVTALQKSALLILERQLLNK